MPVHNDCTKVAFQELEAVGLKGRLVDRGKHQAITWNYNGQERQMIIAVSPSDWRAPKATRTEIRKILKDDGVLPSSKEEEREMEWRAEIEKQFGRFMVRMEKNEKVDQEITYKLKKLENDIEGIISMFAEIPPAMPPPNTPEPVAQVLVDGEPVLAAPSALIIPMVPQQRGRKPNGFWEAMEKQLAENTRLPHRKGYRIVPEHYEKEEEERTAAPAAVVQEAQRFFKNGKPKKGKLRKTGRRHFFSAEGLAKIKANAVAARAALAAKRAAEKGLA